MKTPWQREKSGSRAGGTSRSWRKKETATSAVIANTPRDADYGDRTYGVFNVIPRSGFERNREIEVLATYGNFDQTDSQVSIGDHTERFAYYASVSANRSDTGLMPPEPNALHDDNNGVSGFTSLIFNATPDDQLRLAAD